MPRSIEGSSGQASTEAILAAVIALVGEVGYERMSMDAVAARARASKATIYRRWAGKPALVKAALDRYDAGRMPPVPDSGSLRGDLLAVMRGLGAIATPEHVSLMYGLATAMRCDEELAKALREHVLDDEQQPIAPLVARAVARQELLPPKHPTVADEVSEALVIRQLQLGLPFDEAFILHVVDDVLLPLLL